MIAILSPAKTLNMERARNTDLHTEPIFIKEAGILIKELLKYSPPEMEGLLKINNELAEQNFRRHIRWTAVHDLSNSKQALLAYHGAVYQGVDAGDFNDEQLSFANDHFRILSGLYGVLRPLDLIQPYRLEMETRLKNRKGSSLYSFWKDEITNYFKSEFHRQNSNLLVDLASKEYSSVIDLAKIKAEVITPVFKDYKNGTYKVVTIYMKRARGLMSRFIIKNRILLPMDLKEFNEEGYSYNEYLSSNNEWVFTRRIYS